jgi:hypothetical protein
MRKLRKTGAVDQDGQVVTMPRLPSVAGANKPPGWNRWSAAEKVEHLLGLSLDRMHDYLAWPADDLDPYRLAAQTQVIRVVGMVAAKVGDEARRERNRERVLGRLLRGSSKPRGMKPLGENRRRHLLGENPGRGGGGNSYLCLLRTRA